MGRMIRLATMGAPLGGGGAARGIADLDWALQLDATQGVYTDAGTTPATNGQAIARWADLSGNAAHANQGTADSKPVLNTAGLGGRAAVVFDGSDDALVITNPSSMNFGTGDFVVIAVMQAAMAGVKLYERRAGFQNKQLTICEPSTNTLRIGDGGARVDLACADNTDANLYVFRRVGTSYTVRRNGAVLTGPTTATAFNVSNTANATLGRIENATATYNGAIGYVLARAGIEDADLEQVESELAALFGITLP